MDNILEILVPLAFAAIYFFGNMLSGKKEDEEQPPPLVPRDAASDENRDDAERQRRVQDEIRRKIMERRRTQSGDGPAPQLPRESMRPREEPAKAAPNRHPGRLPGSGTSLRESFPGTVRTMPMIRIWRRASAKSRRRNAAPSD